MKTTQDELIWKIKRRYSGIFKIFIVMLVMFSSFTYITYADTNLTTGGETSSEWISNQYLNDLYDESANDFNVEEWWIKWLRNTFIRVARDLKNLFFIIAWVYFLVLVLKLLFSAKTDEEVSNFKKWIVWISIWIVVTQISYFIVDVLFDQWIDSTLAINFIGDILDPFVAFLQTAASFIFFIMIIYAFFIMVTSNWDEEKAKTWKMTVLYAIIWFILIKISEALVSAIYWKTNDSTYFSADYTTDIGWIALIIVNIINWMNGFIWIIVIIMIIYAGFMVLTGAWDEEKLKKAKTSLIYITIWLFILVVNYLILTFFILDPVTNTSPIL